MKTVDDLTTAIEMAKAGEQTMLRCPVGECDREAKVRGHWCYKHYNAGLIDGTITALTDEERFWSKVDPTGFCWLWIGRLNDAGYGRFGANKKIYRAHRFAYELLVGPIPDDDTLDHLCRITNCVNPDHLDPVSHVVNTLRGFGPMAMNARKTACPKGHEYTPENTYTSKRSMRHCRKCDADSQRRRRQERKLGMMQDA